MLARRAAFPMGGLALCLILFSAPRAQAQTPPAVGVYGTNSQMTASSTEYMVQVIATSPAGVGSPSPEATGTLQSTPGQVRAFIENEVIKIHASAFPWLRKAWDYLTARNVYWRFAAPGYLPFVNTACPRLLEPCRTIQVTIKPNDLTVTHELAHVFTLANLVVDKPVPLGIAHVYFSTLPVLEANCPPVELYADALMILVHGDRARERSSYWSRCIGTNDSLTEEALAVVRSAVSGETPPWFADTYHDTDGEPDLEQFWGDVKALYFFQSVKYQLRDAFGGYCDGFGTSESDFTDGVTRNPWRDGGCVPEAPGNLTVTAIGNGKLAVSWATPDGDGGSPIEAYKVQWKTATQEYDPSRQAVVTNLANPSHTISGLTALEYTVQVLAYNILGDGAAATATATATVTNDAPAFQSAETAVCSVAEYTQPGVPIGAPVAAFDPNYDTLTHTLTGTDASLFAIDEYTGQLTIGTGTVLDPTSQSSYAVTVTVRDPYFATASIAVTITVASGGGSGGGAPAPPSCPPIGSTLAATAIELTGDLLVLQRHDQPGVEVEIGIGRISRDGRTINTIGFVRDGDLGQTYAVVRREGDGQVVRRWIAPDSHLVRAVPWTVVNTQYTFPVGVILAIPLDDQYPWPNMLARRFDGGDVRILAYDPELGQWRHVPDEGTFQTLGFYWCNVTAADAGFFERITLGPPYPSSGVAPRADYPVCQT